MSSLSFTCKLPYLVKNVVSFWNKQHNQLKWAQDLRVLSGQKAMSNTKVMI